MPDLGAIGSGGLIYGSGAGAAGGSSGINSAHVVMLFAANGPYVTGAGLDAGLVPPVGLADAEAVGIVEPAPSGIVGVVG